MHFDWKLRLLAVVEGREPPTELPKVQIELSYRLHVDIDFSFSRSHLCQALWHRVVTLSLGNQRQNMWHDNALFKRRYLFALHCLDCHSSCECFSFSYRLAKECGKSSEARVGSRQAAPVACKESDQTEAIKPLQVAAVALTPRCSGSNSLKFLSRHCLTSAQCGKQLLRSTHQFTRSLTSEHTTLCFLCFALMVSTDCTGR